MIAVIAIVVIILGLWLWRTRTNSSHSPTAGLSPLNGRCGYHDDNLCKFLNRVTSSSNYTATLAQSNDKGVSTTTTFSLAQPESFEIVGISGGKETYHTIAVKKTTYIKDFSDSKWWAQPFDETQANLAKQGYDFSADTAALDPKKTQYKFIARDTCASMICYKYQLSRPALNNIAAQDTAQPTVFVWFDTKDYLLRQTSTQLADAPAQIVHYDYRKVSIKAPKPTKKLKAGELPTGVLNSTSSPATSTTSAPTPPGDGADTSE